MDIQQEIETRQKECRKCIKDFNSFGMFSQEMCKFCSNGAKLHKLETMTSESEKKWDSCDWNSTQLKDFYNG